MVNGKDVKVVFSGVSHGDCCVSHAVIGLMKIKDASEQMKKIGISEVKEEHKKDPVIGPVYKIVEGGFEIKKAEKQKLGREILAQ